MSKRPKLRHAQPLRNVQAEAQCTGKQAFVNGALAYRVAKRSSRAKKGGLAIYHCPHCGKYHIGGQFG